MDPQATFRDFIDGIIEADPEKTHEYGGYLMNWLKKGGFMPEIEGNDFSAILEVLLDCIENGGMFGDDLSPGYMNR